MRETEKAPRQFWSLRMVTPCGWLSALALTLATCFTGDAIAEDTDTKSPRNVLLICVDDLRPELASFGASYIHSPNIDRLASRGRAFHHHYVNAPSCGPSRYTLLTGRFGAANNQALWHRAEKIGGGDDTMPPSMPEWFRQHGFTTVSVGKVSHHPGGRGGKVWDDEDVIEMPTAWDRHLMPVGPWKSPLAAMHGLANGQNRLDSACPAVQATDGPDSIYPDGLIVDEALRQIDQLSADGTSEAPAKPFFLAVGLIKPHLPFGAPLKYRQLYDGVELPPIAHPEKPKAPSTWHRSGEFFGQYDHGDRDPREDAEYADIVRRHYAACVSYADASVGRILERLKQTGADKNTTIVLWGDHGWNLGEHAIWGKHNLFEEALRSPLIIVAPEVGQPGEASDAVVETLDLFPTFCDLANVPAPDFLEGTSLISIVQNAGAKGRTAIGYWQKNRTIRTATHRLILHGKGGVELYDHTTPEKETKNVASEHPELVEQLTGLLLKRLPEIRN